MYTKCMRMRMAKSERDWCDATREFMCWAIFIYQTRRWNEKHTMQFNAAQQLTLKMNCNVQIGLCVSDFFSFDFLFIFFSPLSIVERWIYSRSSPSSPAADRTDTPELERNRNETKWNGTLIGRYLFRLRVFLVHSICWSLRVCRIFVFNVHNWWTIFHSVRTGATHEDYVPRFAHHIVK